MLNTIYLHTQACEQINFPTELLPAAEEGHSAEADEGQ